MAQNAPVTVLSALAAFAVLAAVLTVIPGLDTALVIRSAIRYGRSAGFVTAAGICTGALAWGVAAAVGVSALLTVSRLGYDLLRTAGAIYLVGLGAVMLWRTRRAASTRRAPAMVTAATADRQPRPGGLWTRGLLTNLLNPKVGVFYVATLPQFIPAGSSHLLMGLALAGVHDAESLIWFTALITAAHQARRWLDRDSVKRGLDRITGIVLLGFGLKLAVTGTAA